MGSAALRLGAAEKPGGTTACSLLGADTSHFDPSTAPFVVNCRVDDLAALLQSLQAKSCATVDAPGGSEHGKFGWALDPEGNKVGLWEPAAGR